MAIARTIPDVVRKIVKRSNEFGLPVSFVAEVLARYSVTVRPDWYGISSANPYTNTLSFGTSVISSALMIGRDGRSTEASAISTFYHEMTHAYLDLHEDDSDLKMYLSNAMAHYKKYKLGNGQMPKDPERITQEAAAIYVAQKISTYILTWDALIQFHDLLDEGKIHKDGLRLFYDENLNATKARREYNQLMQAKVYGYEEDDQGKQIHTTAPMPPYLKSYCDVKVLRRQIPMMFRNDSGLWNLELKILQMIEHANLI